MGGVRRRDEKRAGGEVVAPVKEPPRVRSDMSVAGVKKASHLQSVVLVRYHMTKYWEGQAGTRAVGDCWRWTPGPIFDRNYVVSQKRGAPIIIESRERKVGGGRADWWRGG